MATISVASAGTLHPANSGTRTPYRIERVITVEELVAEKGSAIAAADVIEAISVPAGSLVLAAGIYVETALGGGTGSALTLDLGVTGGDVDVYTDGFDAHAAVAGAYSVIPVAACPIVFGATDTLDVLIATQTGTYTAGTLIVWAVLQDIAPAATPGLAVLKS